MSQTNGLDAGEAMGLNQLALNQPALVLGVRSGLDDRDQAVVLRLLEIGFLPGEPVRVISRGWPGQDPLAVRIGHTTFALRRHEASLVQVRPSAGEIGRV
jgi:ferrous iron transport protein A